MYPAAEIRAYKGRPVVGAAIGIGIAAKAAVRGGADFLLVLNAGRLRVMGAPSPVCMLAVGDSNKSVLEVGTREILGHVSRPVFFGACVFDPRLEIDALLATIKQLGFSGVANFPSAIHLDGSCREMIERRGIGFARETEMLLRAREAGLLTFGYATNKAEALALADVNPTVFCLNFGWNAGGVQGLGGTYDLDEAGERARSVIQAFRRLSPNSICLIEGGPIVTADDMFQVYIDARADGYVGGSTIDRVPFEESVTQSTSSFKTAGYFRYESEARDRRVAAFALGAGLAGQSRAFLSAIERASYLASARQHVLVRGEPGSGKTTLARAIHGWSKQDGGIYVLDAAIHTSDFQMRLFGGFDSSTGKRRIGALEMPACTTIIKNIDCLDMGTLAILQSAIASGRAPSETGETRPLTARIVATAQPAASTEGMARTLDGIFNACTILLPPLRERAEDIVPITQKILEALSERRKGDAVQISASGYRFLFSHEWPGNVAELRAMLEDVTLSTKSRTLDYASFAGRQGPAVRSKRKVSDREEQIWILASLKRHRFRKSETAEDLGISRRTLYNKMRKYGLSG